MAHYRLVGQYQVTGDKKGSRETLKPAEILTFDAASDDIARVKVEAFRKIRTPIVNAQLVRIDEVDVQIADTPGYEFLPWDDCECGCQCSNIAIGSLTFSVYSRGTDKFRLSHGHGKWDGGLGSFDSFADADREVRRIAKPHFAKELAAMVKTAGALLVTTP